MRIRQQREEIIRRKRGQVIVPESYDDVLKRLKRLESITGVSGLADGDYGDIFVSGGGASMRVQTAATIIFMESTATTAEIQAALDSLTNGGIVWLSAGTYTLLSTLYLSHPHSTLRGCGDGVTTVQYIADRNTDIIVIENQFCSVEDMEVRGYNGEGNGLGAAGTGRGIVIAIPDNTRHYANPTYAALLGNDPYPAPGRFPAIRRCSVHNTGSWCIYDTGVTDFDIIGNNWTNLGPGTLTGRVAKRSGYAGSVLMILENVNVHFPASGGCLYIGSAAAAPQIKALKTNGYCFNTYTQVTGAGATPLNDMGSVFMFNVFGATFDAGCYFQVPGPSGGLMPDKDACMVSFLNCVNITFNAPKFEILNTGGTCADSNGGAGGREFAFITACNSSGIRWTNPTFISNLNDGGSTLSNWGMKILRTSDQPSDVGMMFVGGLAIHGRTTIGVASGAKVSGEPATWDRNDFMFGGTEGATQNHSIVIEDFVIGNGTTGKLREPTFPVPAFTVANCTTGGGASFNLSTTTGDFSAVNRGDTIIDPAGPTTLGRVRYVTSTGTIVMDTSVNVLAGTTLQFSPPSASVVGRRHFHIRNRASFRFGSWDTCDLTGAGDADDFLARTNLSQNLRSGFAGYVASGDETEGLWITHSNDSLPRLLPFYRKRSSHWATPHTGDLNYRTDLESLFTYNATTGLWETYIKNTDTAMAALVDRIVTFDETDSVVTVDGSTVDGVVTLNGNVVIY